MPQYIHNKRIDRLKRWSLDTIAGISYYQPIFWGIETASGFSSKDGLENRVIMTLFNVSIGSGIAARCRDYWIKKFNATSNISKIAATAFSQLTFYIPVYAVLLLCKNTPIEEICDVLPGYSIATIGLALFYGQYLDCIRKKIGKKLYDTSI